MRKTQFPPLLVSARDSAQSRAYPAKAQWCAVTRLKVLLLVALACAAGAYGQPRLAHGDVIVTARRTVTDPGGPSYVIVTLVVFGRDGVLKGDLTVVATGQSGQPLYRDDIIYVPTYFPDIIKRFDSAGQLLTPFTNARVGALSPGPAGGLLATNASGEIFQFDASGSLIRFRDVQADLPGDGGIDLAADRCTVFYVVCCALARWDICRNTEPVLVTPGVAGGWGSIRVLTDGTFLVVPTSVHPVLHINQAGNVLRNYGFVGGGLALDVDGTSFWTSRAGHLTRVDIATGAILSSTLFPGIHGITVVGEPRAGLLPSAAAGDVPALSSTLLGVLAACLAVMALAKIGSFRS